MSTAEISCTYARLKNEIVVPDLTAMSMFGKSLSDYFKEESSDSVTGQPGISLTFGLKDDPSYLLAEGTPVSTTELQAALRALVNNPVLPIDRVDRIGLIFADSWYANRGVFGVMFDTGWIGNNSERAVAREGAAIFVDAIRESRPLESDYQQECYFTVMHELGHLFNLAHDERSSDKTFMSQSDEDNVYGESAYRFRDDHRQWLSECDSNPHVWPGGEPFLHQASDNRLAPSAARGSSPVTMEIQATREAFWAFEPVELEVTLSTTKRLKLPDRVDPGYDCFRIWIDAPDGTRRYYRSPRRYCSQNATFALAPGHPFRRDISLFCEAGGYTFSQAGEHKVSACFQLADGVVVESNTVSVDVKPYSTDLAFQRYRSLRKPAIARLLYHREGYPAKRTRQELVELLRHADPKLRADLEYAWGRAALKHALGFKKQTFAKYQDEGRSRLQAALDTGALSKVKANHAAELL